MENWPTQTTAALNRFYGNPDANGDGVPDLKWQQENLTTIAAPYPMFYDGKKVSKITVHKRAAESLLRILTRIGEEFTAAERKKYGLDQLGGVFNFRRKRGGSGLSTHSWAIAIDLAVALNGFGVKYGSQPNMMPMRVVEIFQDEGWTWGGLWSTPDAMHFQAADIPGAKASSPRPAPVEQRPSAGAITDTATVAQVQARLYALGYTEVGSRRSDGTFDGKVGPLTRTAILAFRDDNNLPSVNYIDQEMLLAMISAQPRALPAARTEAKPAEVRAQVPEAQAAWWTQIGAYLLGIPAAIGTIISGVLDNLDGARGYLEPVKHFAGDVPPWVWFILVGGAAFFVWQKSRQAHTASVEAFKTGERR